MGKTVAYSGSSKRKQQPEGPHENQPAPKTLAYIRVSTDDQEAQGTPENQRDAINAFCKIHNIKVDEWLEETQSSADDDRAEFDKLEQGIIDGTYSTVIVAAQDRLSRTPLETLRLIDHIQKRKATLYIIRNNLSIIEGKLDPAAEMLISFTSVYAKQERETIRLRTMEGRRRKQKSGQWMVGLAPLGYELNRQTKILQINEEEAKIVRQIFNDYKRQCNSVPLRRPKISVAAV